MLRCRWELRLYNEEIMGKLGPYELDTIVVGDCLEVVSGLPDQSVDLIVTDPPYGARGRASWDVWQGTEWVKDAVRVLKPTGSIYVFIGYSRAPELAMALREQLIERTWITWWKRNSALSQVNNWKSQAEFILYYVKSQEWTWNRWDILEPFDTDGGAKDSPYDGKVPGNVWLISGVNWCSRERTVHPTQKPIGVIEKIIKASSNENDIILDMFIGSGTTAVAAKKLNRHYFGVDINPEYVQLANERVKKVVQ